MGWTFKDFEKDLDALQPLVKEKTLEIARDLEKEDRYSEKEAITEAIKRAEEWFYDLEG